MLAEYAGEIVFCIGIAMTLYVAVKWGDPEW